MAKIKLLHITSSLKMGGAEAVLYTLASHLDTDRFDQEVIYFHEGPYVDKLKSLGVPVYQVKGFFFRYDPIFFVRLYRLINKLNPDCLHTLLWMANFAGRICAWIQSIECISVFHNNLDQDGKVRNAIDWLTLCFAQKLVAVSEQVKASVHDQIGYMPAIEVIGNGIELTRVSVNREKTRGALGFKDGDYVIGAVGRFEPVKRYNLLLECVAGVYERYPQARLCLIGFGSQEGFLRQRAQELGIASLVTFVVGQPAGPYYSLFDCFAQTSAKEGISIALLEAMSYRVPCVVMHDSLHHPVITHARNGLVAHADDLLGLQVAIESLITNKIKATMFGVAAHETVEKKFGAEGMVRAYEFLFREMVAK